eukprot:TRINITY_DN41521_c0_g1_i3.p1 TRINITY_DN41521_c0_g1~~TRINITY_DN41521_c0_g1_i3.p1  ORF type:complete len:325 (-),score=56.28 TRINITY_DN41521_c0_g1_i3:101-1075(-)
MLVNDAASRQLGTLRGERVVSALLPVRQNGSIRSVSDIGVRASSLLRQESPPKIMSPPPAVVGRAADIQTSTHSLQAGATRGSGRHRSGSPKRISSKTTSLLATSLLASASDSQLPVGKAATVSMLLQPSGGSQRCSLSAADLSVSQGKAQSPLPAWTVKPNAKKTLPSSPEDQLPVVLAVSADPLFQSLDVNRRIEKWDRSVVGKFVSQTSPSPALPPGGRGAGHLRPLTKSHSAPGDIILKGTEAVWSKRSTCDKKRSRAVRRLAGLECALKVEEVSWNVADTAEGIRSSSKPVADASSSPSFPSTVSAPRQQVYARRPWGG